VAIKNVLREAKQNLHLDTLIDEKGGDRNVQKVHVKINGFCYLKKITCQQLSIFTKQND
jgi:hypothetical protein